MKKCVIFIQNFSRGAGSERVSSILANGLVKNNYDVIVLSICGKNTCFYPLDNKVKIKTLINKDDVNNRKEFFKVLILYFKFLKEECPDYVIDIFPALSIYTLILKKFFTYKNITWEHFNYSVKLGMNPFGRKLAVKKSDGIITLTEHDKKMYQSDNNVRCKIVPIYNPSPFEGIKSFEKKNSKIVISVGRLTDQKGFDRLIKIWSSLEKNTDWKLLIFGEGEDKEKLERLIQEFHLSRCILAGSVSNIEEFYKKAMLYVSTARFEGLPMTMIEAQTFGLPIVSYNYLTGPSEIIHNGKDGVLIENGNEKEFIETLDELFHDPERIQNMSKFAFEASHRFSNFEFIKKWLTVLEEI